MRPGHDGVTRVLYQLIAHLKQREVENVFFSPIVSPGDHPTTIHRVPSVMFPLYKDYRIAIPGRKYFEDQLREFKPDLLHINSPCSLGYAAVKYARKADIPVVATYHTHFPSYARYYSARAFEALSWNYFRKIYNGCQRVYVPSQPILHELRDHGLKNLEFLPHGVDIEAFHPSFRSRDWRARLGIDGKIVLLFVGRLVWEKDLRTLADAYRILEGMRNDLAFVLVGDGPVRAELQSLMPNAIFLGYQSGVDLSTAFASSDIFAFPSTTETFGNVTIEAMASGIPPVCAREGGSGGLIQDGITGLLTKPRDPVDFAQKINVLAHLPSTRSQIASQGFTFAQGQSWERIFDRQLESYDRVIDEFALYRLYKEREAA
jgi:glycosyltransferase involved in cell wall biosynthesis